MKVGNTQPIQSELVWMFLRFLDDKKNTEYHQTLRLSTHILKKISIYIQYIYFTKWYNP